MKLTARFWFLAKWTAALLAPFVVLWGTSGPNPVNGRSFASFAVFVVLASLAGYAHLRERALR